MQVPKIDGAKLDPDTPPEPKARGVGGRTGRVEARR